MEFGEKVKRAREAKGMTQQTLAEQLYVTRQAVSRWENGARYPDLLTAKNLADQLDTSLDELLSGEEKAVQTQCAPVLDQRAGAVQTALLAFACLAEVVLAIIALPMFWGKSGPTDTYAAAALIGRVAMAGFYSVGLLWSIRGKLTPKYIGLCAMGYYGLLLLQWLFSVGLFSEGFQLPMLVNPALRLVFLVLIFRHFFLTWRGSPWSVWYPVGATALLRGVSYVESLWALGSSLDGMELMGSFAVATLSMAAEFSFLLLLAYQARILAQKRAQ